MVSPSSKHALCVAALLVLFPLLCPAGEMALLGEIGGMCHSVEMEGKYAYVGMGHNLVVLDVGNPAKPTLAGQILLPYPAMQLVVRDRFVFALCHSEEQKKDSRFVAIDASDPRDLRARNSLKDFGAVSGLSIGEGIACLATSRFGLLILDVADPSKPRVLSSQRPREGEASGVFQSEKRAYLLSQAPEPIQEWVAEPVPERSWLTIIDVSNLAAPALEGSCEIEGRATKGVLRGSLAYITAGESGFHIVDVANPEKPTAIGRYSRTEIIEGEDGGDFKHHITDIAVEGNRALISSHFFYDPAGAYSGFFQAIDVSDPAKPKALGEAFHSSGETSSIAVRGDRACMSSGPSLLTLNLANPSTITQSGAYVPVGDINSLAPNGSLTLLQVGTERIATADTSSLAYPRILGDFGDAKGQVATTDTLAFVSDPEQQSFRCFSIADPSRPVQIASIDDFPYSGHVTLSGSFAYIANADNGLYVVDVADPRKPTLAGKTTECKPYSITTSGRYCLATQRLDSWKRRFLVIDISVPQKPSIAGSIEGLMEDYDITASGSLAFVGGHRWVYIIDFQNPAAPRIICRYTSDDIAYSAASDGRYLYVAEQSKGLRILDVSDPRSPVSVRSIPMELETHRVRVSGDRVIVGGSCFLCVFTRMMEKSVALAE